MIRERHPGKSHIKHFITYILLSNTSLVAKSCIARFFDDDACKLSALSDCSTGPPPPPPWRTQSRPCRHSSQTPAVHGADYLAAFTRFSNERLIAVGKFERSVKHHLSMFSKFGFRVPRCNRNDTFVRAFIKSLPFFGYHRASAVGNVAGDCTKRGQRHSAASRGLSGSVGFGRHRRARFVGRS